VTSPRLLALPSTTRQLVFHLPAVLAAILLMVFPIQMLFFVLDKVSHLPSYFRAQKSLDFQS
jgi:hypothetical protein